LSLSRRKRIVHRATEAGSGGNRRRRRRRRRRSYQTRKSVHAWGIVLDYHLTLVPSLVPSFPSFLTFHPFPRSLIPSFPSVPSRSLPFSSFPFPWLYEKAHVLGSTPGGVVHSIEAQHSCHRLNPPLGPLDQRQPADKEPRQQRTLGCRPGDPGPM